jgi:hypothetical protein
VGNLVKQGIGAMIPGAEDRTVLERAGEAGRAGLLGGATQGVGNVLARPIAQLLSTGQVPKAAAAWLAGRAERAAAPGVVAEGRALERAIPGLELDTAQLTGSQSLKRVQEASEFGPFASSFGREGLEGNMNAVMAELDRTMSSITGGVQVDAQALGHTLKTTRDDWADQLFRARSQQAAQDFAAVDSAVGHTPIVDPSRARAIIQKRMAENTDDHGERILEGLQKDLLHWVKRFDDPLSASDMQKYLRLFGNAGYGKGAKVFDSLHMGEAVRLQRDLHRALLDDLADTAAQAQGSTAAKQLSDALMRARGNYKMASEQIEKLEKSALNRIVGEITEENYYRAGERFLGLKSVNAQDQIIRSVRGVDPGSADVLARGVLENAIERSMVVPQGSATGERIFSPTRFLKMMPEKKVRDVLFGDPAIGQQIDNIMAAMRRLNLKGYKGESPTAEKLINYGTISGIGVGQLLSPMTGAAALIGIIGRRQVAKHLMTTQGRNALQQIMHPTGPTTPPHARKALMYLMSENVVE